MKKILTFFCLTLLLTPSFAFSEDSPWKKTLAFGFSYADGNSDTTLLTSELKAKYDKDKNIWKLELGYNFGEDDDETNVDNNTALVSYKHLMNRHSYYGLGADYNQDDIASVKYRTGIHPVLGHFFIKSETIELSLEGGPSYIFEEVDSVRNDYLAPRIADTFEYHFSKTSKIFQESEVIFDIDDSENYLINSKLGVEAKMTDALSLVLTLTSNYDNQPASDSERHDMLVVSSLSYAF